MTRSNIHVIKEQDSIHVFLSLREIKILKVVKYNLGLHCNILSIRKLINDDHIVVFDHSSCIILTSTKPFILLTLNYEDNTTRLYKLLTIFNQHEELSLTYETQTLMNLSYLLHK